MIRAPMLRLIRNPVRAFPSRVPKLRSRFRAAIPNLGVSFSFAFYNHVLRETKLP